MGAVLVGLGRDGVGVVAGGSYGYGVRPPDQGNLVVCLDDPGTVDGGLELGCVKVECAFDAVEPRDLIGVQSVDGVCGLLVEKIAQRRVEVCDVLHVIHFRGGLALLEAGRPSVPKHLPGLNARNPEDQLVTLDIVGYGAPREISPSHVIETETELA